MSRFRQLALVSMKKILEALTLGGWVALMVMMLWGAGDVILQIFGYSLPATVPWTEVLSVIALMLPLAYVTGEKAHINVDLLTERLNAKGKRLANMVSLIFVFLFSALMAWQQSIQAWESLKLWERDFAIITIYWFPGKIALALGFIGTSLITAFQIIDECLNWNRR